MTQDRKKIGLPYLFKKVNDGEPISWLTCYDYPTAYLQEQAGVEMILVGDSLGMTMLGYDSTLPVTMNDMIRHTSAVRRGAPTAFVIGDMPYMTYQASTEDAIRNAGRFMAEASCDAIKLEGGAAMAPLSGPGGPIHRGVVPGDVGRGPLVAELAVGGGGGSGSHRRRAWGGWGHSLLCTALGL